MSKLECFAEPLDGNDTLLIYVVKTKNGKVKTVVDYFNNRTCIHMFLQGNYEDAVVYIIVDTNSDIISDDKEYIYDILRSNSDIVNYKVITRHIT